jgi:hypothetical protein
MDILFILHLLLTVILLSIPFWHYNYLKYGVYIPLIITILWLFFGGCPLTQIQDIEKETFTLELLKSVLPNMKLQDAEHLNTFLLVLITVTGFYKLNKIKEPLL